MDQNERDEEARWRAAHVETLHLESRRLFHVDCEKEEWKLDTLSDLLGELQVGQFVIFCNGRTRASWLAERITAAGWTVSTVLDESADGSERRAFEVGETIILVTTDAGPGLSDLHGSPSAINFDVPSDNDEYIRRVGGCGKFGRRGLVIDFVTEKDRHRVRELEEHFNVEIPVLPANVADYV